jgi:hypothetical protein
MMYALGRNAQYYDGAAIRGIAQAAGKRNYTFASLVEGVVTSDQFQMRLKREPRKQVESESKR